ncbi:MAG: NigD-like C-terminal domain-containing protein, partial [Bacteroidales bacterium]
MKRSTILWGLISLFIGLGFFWSCDDNDDDYSLDRYYQSIVTVESDSTSDAYWLQMTNGDLLWPVNQGFLPFYNFQKGERGLATYNIVGGADGKFTNLIRLISMSEILTKDIIKWTPANKDTLALANWNPGVIKDGWIENGFINLIFEFRWHNKAHIVNLVQNDTITPAPVNPQGGVWSLQFCQNSNGDWIEHGSVVRSLVSFKIPSSINTSSLTKVNIEYVNWNGQRLNYAITS